MESKEYKLGELATFSNGVNFDKEAYLNNGVRLITVSDFGNRIIPDYETLEEISSDVVRDKDLVEKNDILFVRSNGNKELVGRCMLIDNVSKPTTYSGFCIRCHLIHENTTDSKYFTYYFKNQYFRKCISNASGGTNIQNLNQEILSKHKIQLPPLPTQQKIASILSAYDNFIQNYKKQIEDLQTTASELYKEWFVRFRFPGYEKVEMKDSCIGKIPITFEVKKQNEVIRDYIGGGWGEDEESEKFPIEAAVVRGADFPEFTNGDISTCPVRYHKTSNYNSRIINADDIVLEVSGGTQEQPVGRTVIVSQERLNRFDNKLICASFCKLIRLDKTVISPFFYYYWMQFVYYTRIIDRYQLQSTGIINFKFEYFLRKGDVLIPPTELMESFDSKVKVIHSKIEKLAISIENLTQQRDLLLPRLMSGKLEVK